MTTIRPTPYTGPLPIDWKSSNTAIPALMDAAEWVHGGPVDHYTEPDKANSDLAFGLRGHLRDVVARLGR